MKDRNSSVGGIGFFGALTILFIGLKLGNVITWSWLWILAPMWIPTIIGIMVLIIYALYYEIRFRLDKRRWKRFRERK
jgi:hypothetical protein|nr:MAG TPA: transmembrane protein [Caudoviricetes sp.]